MGNPIAVLISDLHFNINTLPLASAALQDAIKKSDELNVPLIIAGDLQDTKAIIRAEVANKLLDLLANVPIYLLVGNHDLVNEKGQENALEYLRDRVVLIDYVMEPSTSILPKVWFIPYQNSAEQLKNELTMIPKGSILIMHQGFKGANMGDYIQDKTSIDPEIVKDYIVISGHYHRHQTIGTVTYIGSPYTMTFGEANDGPKGFLILNEDGTYTREILNLRKHVIVECDMDTILGPTPFIQPNDLLWVKYRGPASELRKIKKSDIGNILLGHNNFKLELIPHENLPDQGKTPPKKVTESELFDMIIDQLDDTDKYKEYLKKLWRNLL